MIDPVGEILMAQGFPVPGLAYVGMALFFWLQERARQRRARRRVETLLRLWGGRTMNDLVSQIEAMREEDKWTRR